MQLPNLPIKSGKEYIFRRNSNEYIRVVARETTHDPDGCVCVNRTTDGHMIRIAVRNIVGTTDEARLPMVAEQMSLRQANTGYTKLIRTDQLLRPRFA